MRSLRGLLLTAALSLFAMPAFAAIPATALVDGVLTSAGGTAAADGDYNVTFSVFDAATGGTATWSEVAKITLSGGRFQHSLGSVTPIDATKLAALSKHWLAVKVGDDPELPRQALHSTVFAMVAGQAASVACDGCIGSGHMANGAVAAAKVGFNYAGATTKGGAAIELECSACVSVGELKFDADVDLAGNSIKAKNGTFGGDLAAATVTATSFVGDGSKLTGIKTPAGTCSKAGEVVKGINPDGSLKCVAALDPTALPKDGLNEISNDLLSNQFLDTIVGAAGTAIPDNTGADANATLDFPDIGVTQSFELTVEVANTDLSKVAMTILPPDDKKTGWTLCDPCGEADAKSYKVTFNPDNLPKSGDLVKWIGANAKGVWNLKILDTSYCLPQAPGNDVLCNTTAKTDGSIVAWSIKIQTLSNKKAKVAGDLYVDGKLWGKENGHGVPGGPVVLGNGVSGLKLGAENVTCTEAIMGTLRWDATWGNQVCDQQYDKAGKISYEWIVAAPRVPMWSGGCKTQPSGQPGWAAYCLDGVDFNTADDYLSVTDAAKGHVTIKKSGFYRFNFFTIQHGCGSKHLRLYINDVQRAYFHNNDTDQAGAWSNNYADLTWPVRKGDVVRIEAHGDGCNPYRFHHWDTTTAHSRLQVQFVGRWHVNSTATF